MASEHSFIKKFSAFIQAKSLVVPGDKVVLAVSGGVDSMVMLDVFHALSGPWHLKLVIAHINHQLRGEESEGDETFVREVAERYGTPVFCRRADVIGLVHSKKISKQEAARELRYTYLEDIRRQTSSGHIATAHHADDNAETVLLNILRGTGIRGLGGIPFARNDNRIIRPMLFARRDEILAFAEERRLTYRNDSSNASTVYARNYLRQTIVPLLKKEFGPEVCDTLNRLSETMREFSEYLDRLVDERFGNIVTLNANGCALSIPSLQREPSFLQEEIILRTLHHLGIEPSNSKINDILGFCGHQTGHSLMLSGGMVVHRNRTELNFARAVADENLYQTFSPGESYSGPDFTFSIGSPGPVPPVLPRGGLTEYIDAEKLDKSLVLRSWRDGDWFVPLGMGGRKKLSDFFADEKISLRDKKKIPILESNDSIVWVCGKRLDDRFKITAHTRRAIKLTYSPTISATPE
jgi:tRNA(Ile)-lysidine synthase